MAVGIYAKHSRMRSSWDNSAEIKRLSALQLMDFMVFAGILFTKRSYIVRAKEPLDISDCAFLLLKHLSKHIMMINRCLVVNPLQSAPMEHQEVSDPENVNHWTVPKLLI